MLCDKLLKAVVNNPPTINDEGEVNEERGTHIKFTNPKGGCIPGSRWRELRLNKDPLEEIIEAGFCAPKI